MPAPLTDAPPIRSPGDQPLPGYTLLAPLGRGGFGEVWKCEVPGGLHKAVKFVAGDPDAPDGGSEQLRQEYAAFLEMKAIRHPFLLTLERVEMVGNELVMVMELADRHIGERFQECREGGQPGIPRGELLGYVREAAEVLDVLTARYGLQHLDIKPANLFLTAGHVQVGDYGLVSKLDNRGQGGSRGLTPRYAAPEVLNGQVHTRSDQYSLALVYAEMLTGVFPYNGKTARQLMIQHLAADPDLSALTPGDRAAVGAALAKQPEDRFGTCREFAEALGREAFRPLPPLPKLPGVVAPSRPTGDEPTDRSAATVIPGLPKLVSLVRRPPAAPEVAPAPERAPAGPVRLPGVYVPQILSVLPVGWLRGLAAPGPDVRPEEVVRAVLGAAGGDPDAVLPAGGAERRFLTTIDPRLALMKLGLLRDEYNLVLNGDDPLRVVLRKPAPVPEAAPTGLFGGFGKKPPPPPPSGLEVVVLLPERGGQIGEVVASGAVFGTPPPDFARRADRAVEKLLDGVRRHLGNVEERRRYPRIPAEFAVTVYPISADGRVGTPAAGRCRDVSAGGLSLVTETPPGEYAYVSFDDVPGVTGLAVLVRTLHQKPGPAGVLVTGRYKLDMCPPAGEGE